jgi:transcriptional regulator with XRE-family HTH domain
MRAVDEPEDPQHEHRRTPGRKSEDRIRRLVRSMAGRRRELNLSQTQVAARMGTSQAALARLEVGVADPRMSTIERYAAALEGELVHGVRSPKRRHRPLVIPALLVTAADLEDWAGRIDAQTQLGDLVRRLVRETTAGITRLDFPSGEGVQHAGWDGVAAVTDGNEYVPNGLSAWELGTGSEVKKKAEKDFRTRSEKPRGLEPAETTFVFVTPRRWRWRPDKTTWQQQKRAAGPWRDVRLIDGDDLAAWLELAPPIHYWLSERLKKFPASARPLELWWEDWAEETRPALTADLLVAGRGDAEKAVADHLRRSNGTLTIRADSPDEAVAFIAATIERLPSGDRDAVMARSLVLRDDAGWRHAVGSETGLVLIPRFGGVALSQDAATRHVILVPVGNESVGQAGALELPRLGRLQAGEALRQMLESPTDREPNGFGPDKAEDLSLVARRSLLSLRRRLAVSRVVQQPLWAAPDKASELAPLVLVGSWSERFQGDKDALAELTGLSYQELSRRATKWQRQSDPPLRRVGDTWYMVDREDTWSLLAPHLTDEDLQHFDHLVTMVLGTPLPVTELPPDEQWKANILGRKAEHSKALRDGLAETAAIMAARGDLVRIGGGAYGARIAGGVVFRLLAAANADETGRLWASVSDLLPLLAEAAPETFLDALESAIESRIVPRLFIDAPERDPMFLSSPHTGLLWALEDLAWSPEYLGRVAMILARLQELDPGGRLRNRPSESLREIFLPWHPQTAAPVDARLAVLDTLIEQEPDAAWSLLARLLPQSHDIAMPTYAPRWREWKPSEERPPTFGEVGHLARELVDRMLAAGGTDGNRWATLARSVSPLPPELRDRILDALADLDVGTMDEEGRLAVRDALREQVAHHREFPAADWAMPKDTVDRIADLSDRFAVDDPVRGAAWLFTHRPRLPDVHEAHLDWQAYQEAVDDARATELRATYKRLGLDGLRSLAQLVDLPGEVGRVIGFRRLLGRDEESAMLQDLASTESALRTMAQGYVFGRFRADEWTWAEPVVAEAASWEASKQAEFLLGLRPPSARLWRIVESLGATTEHAYWERVAAWISPDEDAEYAVRKLIQHGRPHAAVDLLAHRLHGGDALDPELVAGSLEAAGTTEPRGRLDGMFQYDVGQLLDHLNRSDGLDPNRLARLELLYLPLLQFGERPPRLLHQWLATDPRFFAEVLSWVFKPEHGEPRDVTDQLQRQAHLGYELLHSWKGLPGEREDGTIDGEALNAWIEAARERCRDLDRITMGDQYIGRALAHAPSAEANIWPPEEVCRVLERMKNRQIERGLETEVFNSRGVTTRGLTDGGTQERALVERYSEWAAAALLRWPRTATVLRRIADSYAANADREDLDAQLRQDQGW